MPSGVDEVNTYFRKASQSLFNTLTATAGNIWVNGPPGVGKSLTIFGWLIHQTLCEQSVLWVHCTGGGASTAKTILVNKGIASYAEISMNSIAKSVTSIISKYTINIVVLDGIRVGIEGLYMDVLKTSSEVKLIGCSSYRSANFSNEELSNLQLHYILVWSWTDLDYESAFALNVFGNITTDLLEEAVFYGGGSIRAVLGLLRNKNDQIQILNNAVAQVTNFTALFSGLVGLKAPSAVNTLMKISEEGACTMLSKYVTEKISEKCANAFVVEARRVCPGNPAWQGWVHEIDFIARMKQCHKEKKSFILQRVGRTRSPPYVNGPKKFSINVVSDCRVGPVEDQESGTFYIPQKWNQGCYDGVYYLLRDKIHHFWFFQCTISTKHRYLFQYVSEFLEACVPLPAVRSLRSDGLLVQGRSGVRVHFYVVGTKESAKKVTVNKTDIDSIESVKFFDSTFNQSSIKVVYLQNI